MGIEERVRGILFGGTPGPDPRQVMAAMSDVVLAIARHIDRADNDRAENLIRDASKYWMVHSPLNRTPTVKHSSYQSAVDEATRLAAKHPGERFFVLSATCCISVNTPELTTTHL